MSESQPKYMKALDDWLFTKMDARCLFQLPMSGKHDNPQGYINGYIIKGQIVLVRTYPPPYQGWDIFMQSSDTNDIEATLAATERALERKVVRPTDPSPVKAITVYLKRSMHTELSDDENERETGQVHDLFENFPDVGPISVCDNEGHPLYWAAEREGEDE